MEEMPRLLTQQLLGSIAFDKSDQEALTSEVSQHLRRLAAIRYANS